MKRETRLRPARGGALFAAVVGLTPTHVVAPAPACVCFLCHRGVDNGRRFAVCAECDEAHEIRASWAIDYGDARVGSDDRGRECRCPGWLWMNEDDDASFNIERCNSCALLRDDAEAAKAMVERCNIHGVEWSA